MPGLWQCSGGVNKLDRSTEILTDGRRSGRSSLGCSSRGGARGARVSEEENLGRGRRDWRRVWERSGESDLRSMTREDFYFWYSRCGRETATDG